MAFDPPSSTDLPAISSLAVRPAVCRSCAAAIAVPESARFCPRCGGTLHAACVSGVEEDAVDRFAAIREAELAALEALMPVEPPLARVASSADFATAAIEAADLRGNGDGPPPVDQPLFYDFHSDVLEAYASALYRLGWRYERGHGAHRNPAEAIRCYCKSARLGNPNAVSRLHGEGRVSPVSLRQDPGVGTP